MGDREDSARLTSLRRVVYAEGMTQTTITHLPNGEKGIIGSPAHRLLQHMASTVTGYAACGAGGICSVTQLRSLARNNWVALHHAYECPRAIVVGAYLTPRGERYCEMLDAAEARAQLVATA